jgi:hypothetical protein
MEFFSTPKRAFWKPALDILSDKVKRHFLQFLKFWARGLIPSLPPLGWMGARFLISWPTCVEEGRKCFSAGKRVARCFLIEVLSYGCACIVIVKYGLMQQGITYSCIFYIIP